MIPVSYNLRSLMVRRATTFATAFGGALVVFVFASVLMLSHGIEQTLGRSGSPDCAIVLRKGSEVELSSGIEESQVGLILANRDVARTSAGQPDGVGEIVAVILLNKRGTDGQVSNVQVRGIDDHSGAFRPEVKLVDGRFAKAGTDEVVIGKSLRGRFDGLDLNGSFELRKNRPVRVVGVFEARGSSYESEVWADINTVRTAFGREGIVSSVRVRLQSPGRFESFKLAMEQDRQLGLETLRETVYYEKQSEGLSLFIKAMGLVIAFFFAVGAIIGATITMYSSIANRSREIGTLRALGFSRGSILVSFLLESVALVAMGGVVGVVGSLAMGFVKFSTMNFANWSEISFSFEPTPKILLTALLFGGGMGLIGGLFPAIRAARMSPLQAMRGG